MTASFQDFFQDDYEPKKDSWSNVPSGASDLSPNTHHKRLVELAAYEAVRTLTRSEQSERDLHRMVLRVLFGEGDE